MPTAPALDPTLRVPGGAGSIPRDGWRSRIVTGAAAGNVTVTGIGASDILLAVVRLGVTAQVMRQKLVAGAAAGNVTVTGIATTDTLVSVIAFGDAAADNADLTSEFTISATNTINNTGGTSSATKTLLVTYYTPLTENFVDLGAEFTITAADTINNTGGTASTNDKLLVVWQKVNS